MNDADKNLKSKFSLFKFGQISEENNENNFVPSV